MNTKSPPVLMKAALTNKSEFIGLLRLTVEQLPFPHRQSLVDQLLIDIVSAPTPKKWLGPDNTVVAARALLMAGANPNAIDDHGNAAVICAFGRGGIPAGHRQPTLAMLRLLEEFGANLLVENNGLSVRELGQRAEQFGDTSLSRRVDRMLSYHDGRRPPRLVTRAHPGKEPLMTDRPVSEPLSPPRKPR